MVHIKQLAPTLIDALNAVEQGCRKVQDDTHFVPNMRTFLTVAAKDICIGCLATCTLMQLANKTAKDILDSFNPVLNLNPKQVSDRASAFGIDEGRYNDDISEFSFFEAAIDSLRHSELYPLLKFYGLNEHANAKLATNWVENYNLEILARDTNKRDLICYADFLHSRLIPKMIAFFD
jgi:hypothetical protein